MKSFREFMVIVEDKMAERLSKMSASEFEQFLKGRSPGEAASFKAKRIKVPGSTFTNKGTQPQPEQPSGGTQQTKTPPKASQTPPPSSNPPKSSTPPPQPSGGSGGRGTPPPRPSSSTTTPSSGTRPNQYRAPGTGRTEIPRSTTNPGKDPGAFQTLKNNAKNIFKF